MSARKLVYQGMVLGPVVLLSLLGIGARAYEDSFEPRRMSREDQAVVAAYTEPVRAFHRLPWLLDTKESQVEARRVARLWVRLHDEGRLRPLPQGPASATVEYAAKDEVTLARNRLLAAMGHCAEASAQSGDIEGACSDLLLALHLAQVNKQMDLKSLAISARRQVALGCRLRELSTRLNKAEKVQIAKQLLRIAKEDEESLRFLAGRGGKAPSDRLVSSSRTGAAGATPDSAADAKKRIRSSLIAPGGGTAYVVASACCDERLYYSTLRNLIESWGVKAFWSHGTWSTAPMAGEEVATRARTAQRRATPQAGAGRHELPWPSLGTVLGTH